jgi:hypothetical protein
MKQLDCQHIGRRMTIGATGDCPICLAAECKRLEAEIGQAHHVLDLMKIRRTSPDSDGGTSQLTLLGRMREIQAHQEAS